MATARLDPFSARLLAIHQKGGARASTVRESAKPEYEPEPEPVGAQMDEDEPDPEISIGLEHPVAGIGCDGDCSSGAGSSLEYALREIEALKARVGALESEKREGYQTWG